MPQIQNQMTWIIQGNPINQITTEDVKKAVNQALPENKKFLNADEY